MTRAHLSTKAISWLFQFMLLFKINRFNYFESSSETIRAQVGEAEDYDAGEEIQNIEWEIQRFENLDAINNPLEVKSVRVDSQRRPSQRIIGEKAEIVINPETKKAVSINPTSSKKASSVKEKKSGRAMSYLNTT